MLANNNFMCTSEIIQIIYNKTGIDARTIGQFAYDNAISKRMNETGYNNTSEYLSRLKDSNKELTKLIDEIIVPETWFFRDNAAFDTLSLHARNTIQEDTTLRILSLPSSSGEEAYSAAITLHEAGFKPDQFKIDGIDICQKNVASATAGIYRENSFRQNMPEYVQQKYFNEINNTYHIKEQLKQSVSFTKGNLFDDNTLSIPSCYDVIFCKNLFIYFDSDKKEISFNKISAALKKNGLLLIGHSECGIIPENLFTPSNIPRSFGFFKKERLPRKKRSRAKTGKPLPSVVQKRKTITTKIANNPAPAENEQIKPTVHTLDEALKYANNGNLEAALEACKKLPLDAQEENYFSLMATIHSARGNQPRAESFYRKALFLNPKHIESLTHLAFILMEKGDIKNAGRLKQRLQRITDK